jgi:hypothetical protein
MVAAMSSVADAATAKAVCARRQNASGNAPEF